MVLSTQNAVEDSSQTTTTTTTTTTNHDIDKLLEVIMDQVSKIEKNELADNGYTRIILIFLILIFVLLIKTKIYKLSTCFNKRKSPVEAHPVALDKITIQEYTYNINSLPTTA